MLTIGYDIGSSSIKAALYDVESGKEVAHSSYPKDEMKIDSPKPGWAEQDPEAWWNAVKIATADLLAHSRSASGNVSAIGISYQMHGLVVVDKNQKVLRPSIIWCDSRAVGIGDKAFREIGVERCLSQLLNSPGNFTASKLRWVIENEPRVYDRVYKFMLPGDYIAMKLTGDITITAEGLSEGILWDFQSDELAHFMMKQLGIDERLVPEIVPTFGQQGKLSDIAARELGLKVGTPVAYRSGDQPNNAFSLNVLKSGEIAATAGTSGVVYGVSDQIKFDAEGRVNTFAHVNHTSKEKRLGILLCINGTAISNNWMRKMLFDSKVKYDEMNEMAERIPVGSEGVLFLPFGNGAERMLTNLEPGASFSGLNFNLHSRGHLIRSVLEGVAFSFQYGINILKELAVDSNAIRAGLANMFLSKTFRSAVANLSGAVIQLYNTDGALGAARGAAFGAGFYRSFDEAFNGLQCLMTIEPDEKEKEVYADIYGRWLVEMGNRLAKTRAEVKTI